MLNSKSWHWSGPGNDMIYVDQNWAHSQLFYRVFFLEVCMDWNYMHINLDTETTLVQLYEVCQSGTRI